MKRLLASCIAAAAVASAAVALAALTAEPVITGPTDQFGPAAMLDTWVAWSERRATEPRWDAHIQLQGGGNHRHLHRRTGSNSYIGGFTRGKVLFQDVKGSSSDLFLYNIGTGGYSPPPSGINTDLWEWSPDVSNLFILFGRNKFVKDASPWKVILYDRQSKTFRTLDSVSNACGCIYPGQVNDRYAVWTRCVGNCNVWVFDTQTLTKTKVPNPDLVHQYYGSITPGGQVYFFHSAVGCGANTRIMRWTVGDVGDPEAIYALPSGTDGVWRTYIVEGMDGHDDLYFDKASCGDNRYRGNIYVLRDVELASPIAMPTRSGSSSPRTLPVRIGATPD